MFMDFALRANDFSNFNPAKVKFQCQLPWDQSLTCLLNHGRKSRRVKDRRQAVNGNYKLDSKDLGTLF